MIEVRPAERKDMEALAMIQTSSWKKAFENILSVDTLEKYTNPEECKTMLENVYDAQRGFFYIGYLDEKPCAELFWCEGNEMQESAEIVALHSLSGSWGSGIGKAVMDRAIEDIRQKRFKCIYLWVFTENRRARRFYEKCGFVSDGERHISSFDEAEEMRYVYSCEG